MTVRELSVYSLNGNLVHSQRISGNAGGTFSLSDLGVKGTHIVKLNTPGEATITKKVALF